MRWIYRLFNHDKIDRLTQEVETYDERIKQLEEELREYKGYKLRYRVTKLYVNDKDALEKIIKDAKKVFDEDIVRRQEVQLSAIGAQPFGMGIQGMGASHITVTKNLFEFNGG